MAIGVYAPFPKCRYVYFFAFIKNTLFIPVLTNFPMFGPRTWYRIQNLTVNLSLDGEQVLGLIILQKTKRSRLRNQPILICTIKAIWQKLIPIR